MFTWLRNQTRRLRTGFPTNITPEDHNAWLHEQVRAFAVPQPYAAPLSLGVNDNPSGETWEMRRGYRAFALKEPSVKASLLTKMMAVSQLDLVVKPYNKRDKKDREIARFVKWSINNCEGGSHQLVQKIGIHALIDGFSVTEKVQDILPEEVPEWQGFWTLKQAKAKDTQPIRFRLDLYKNIVGVRSMIAAQGGMNFSPKDFIIYTHLMMFENPFGFSDLRAANRAANLIEAAIRLRAILLENFSGPYLIAKASDTTVRQRVTQILKEARARGYIVIPDGAEIEVINLATSAPDQFQNTIEDLRQEIVTAIQGAYLQLLEGGVSDGRGNTQVHKNISLLYQWWLATTIASALNFSLVPDLVYPNFGHSVGLPTISLGGVDDTAIQAQLDRFKKGQDLGVPISLNQVCEVGDFETPESPEDILRPPQQNRQETFGGGKPFPDLGNAFDPQNIQDGKSQDSPDGQNGGRVSEPATFLGRATHSMVGNQQVSNLLRGLPSDPVVTGSTTQQLQKALGYSHNSDLIHDTPRYLAFVQWQPGTSATGESGWVSEGGQFRKEKPQGVETGEHDQQNVKKAAEVFTSGIKDVIPEEVKKNSSVMEKVQDAALTAAAHVYMRLVRATPLLHKAMNLFFDVTDDPRTDFSKIGYNPTLGTAGHEIHDPVKAQLGISAHLASTIAVKVLGTALYHFRKRVLGHFQAADYADWIAQAAQELANLINLTNDAFGLSGRANPARIEMAMRQKAKQLPTEEFADDQSTQSALLPGGNPQVIRVQADAVPSEVALAGQDGAEIAKLLGQSKAYGVKIMAEIVSNAIKRYKGTGRLLDRAEVRKLADALSAVNSTADLLGRTRVRERADRANVFRDSAAPPDVPFATFADKPVGIMATPEEAVAFFMSRRPELGIDPHRYGELQRRQAFTLAESTNLTLTQKIQELIGSAMRQNLSTPESSKIIREALNTAGVTPKNPQYSEMVFRTNAMDSFQQGMYDEGRNPEVSDSFACWQYLIVDDDRTGDDHRPKGNRFYPSHAAFASVRGDRVYNCRCSMRWVDWSEWKELEREGKEIELRW